MVRKDDVRKKTLEEPVTELRQSLGEAIALPLLNWLEPRLPSWVSRLPPPPRWMMFRPMMTFLGLTLPIVVWFGVAARAVLGV